MQPAHRRAPADPAPAAPALQLCHRMIAVQSDDQSVASRARFSQQPDMARMQEIEQPLVDPIRSPGGAIPRAARSSTDQSNTTFSSEAREAAGRTRGAQFGQRCCRRAALADNDGRGSISRAHGRSAGSGCEHGRDHG